MSKFEGKQLSYAVAHGTIHVPRMGQIGPTLDSVGSPIHRAVKMTLQGEFVLLEVGDSTIKDKTHKVLVPVTNFSHMVLAQEFNAPNSKA